MSALGSFASFYCAPITSGLPPGTDILGVRWHVSNVPILLQKSAIAMVRLRRRFSGTVFLSRRV
jgi:hypothetical protein